MTRPIRIARNIAVGAVLLLLVLALTLLVVVRTQWFRDVVERQIISATESGIGGKTEIGAFDFDVSRLRATVTDFVIHGEEPAGAAPLVKIARIEVDIRLLTSLHRLFEIARLEVERPAANIIVMSNGLTNIPAPNRKAQKSGSPLATVVDLAIGHFDLTNGLLTVQARPQAVNLSGNNLHAQFTYNFLTSTYQGQLGLNPLYVVKGRNTPVNFSLNLPLTVQRDRIGINAATLTTPASSLAIDASVDNIQDPRLSARLSGHIATADLSEIADMDLETKARGVPSDMSLEASATASSEAIDITGLRARLGQSTIEASGPLKGAKGKGALTFTAQLALNEIGRLARLSAAPAGTVALNGTARFDTADQYDVNGKIEARNVGFRQGAERIDNVNLAAGVHADAHTISLNGLRLAAFGGEFLGDVALRDFERYQLDGRLTRLDIKAAMRTLGQTFPYDGIVSGPVKAGGSVKVPFVNSLVAQARLSISPAPRGIPVSGRLNADYNGAADNITLTDSFLALPHSRLTLSGSLERKLNVSLTTHDVNELLAAASVKNAPSITLSGAGLELSAVVTGSLSSPHIDGHLAANRFSVEGRRFDALSANLTLAASGAAISKGFLARDPMQARFDAAVGLKKWTPDPRAPVSADISVQNGDLADVMALAGNDPKGYSGALLATARIDGAYGNPKGSAHLHLGSGQIAGEPFDQADAQINLTDRLIAVPAAFVQAGTGRINLSAEFHHPSDSFTTGQLHARIQSNQINLAQVRAIQNQRANTSGEIQLDADIEASLKNVNNATEFLLTSANGSASARTLRFDGQNYGDFNATARTAGSSVTYSLTSDFAGSNIRLNGNTQLVRDYPSTADAAVSNLPVERLLVLAKRTDIPVRGILSATAHLAGSVSRPQAEGSLDLTRAVVYDEPVDRLHARLSWLDRSVDIPQFEIVSGPSRIDLTGRYEHPAGNLQQGVARFRINSSLIDFARVHNIQKLRPGLEGTIRISADGAGKVNETEPRILFTMLDASLSASNIAAQGKRFGDLNLTANTGSGNQLNFALDSNLADAAVQAQGSAQLTGDYPVDAQLTFSNLLYTHIQSLLGTASVVQPAFEGVADGQISLKGPILKVDQLRGGLRLTRLNLTTIPRPGVGKPVTIQNQGPVAVTLAGDVIRIESARITGPETDLEATGTASLKTQALDLAVKADTNLNILPSFDRDIYSTGKLILATTVRGSFSQPLLNGQLTLQDASLNYSGIANGISNANGVIVFNGNNATIRKLTAESGGGALSLSGFVGFTDRLRFGLTTHASDVRVRAQEGVSIVAGGDLRLNGTMQGSVVSGTVLIDQVNWNPQSDIGSILSRAAPPIQSASAPSPLLDNMKLDFRVRSSAGLGVQASLAQNLQADVDLRVRGSAAEPGVLGRITINEGDLVFFGSTYSVNNGTIAFYNPLRITPVLDLSLGTQAHGVEVTLHVTGPVDDMKLSYTSNPPLQFSEIVALLASGRTPTSDPTLLANQPQVPQQSFQQMGESAILGKALADPVASRLQRVFGVSQLKIDPAFQTGSSIPTARLTFQQRINGNITFTYTSALDDPNGQIIRVEWAFSPTWSATATRDQNGLFSLNFFYKRQFR